MIFKEGDKVVEVITGAMNCLTYTYVVNTHGELLNGEQMKDNYLKRDYDCSVMEYYHESHPQFDEVITNFIVNLNGWRLNVPTEDVLRELYKWGEV